MQQIVFHRATPAWMAGAGLLLALAGCGGGGAGSNTAAVVVVPNPGQPSSGPASVQVLTISSATLASGGYDAASFDPLASLSATTINFRLVTAGDSLQGTPRGALGATRDASSHVVSVGSFNLASCELTQAQWTALATRAGLSGPDQLAPWLASAPAGAVGSAASVANHAASALSYDLVTAALAGFNALSVPGQPTLRLPTAAEWEHASRAGSISAYSWGADETAAAVTRYALVRETRRSLGVDDVAGSGGTQRQANAFGFYDMAGNVWEWIDSGVAADAILRGGSWSDNLLSARCANQQTMDRSIPYATAGVRLVLVLP